MLTLAITSLFLLPIIVSLVCKQYKVTVFSAVCAVPSAASFILYLCGYSSIPEITYVITILSTILLVACIIVSFPFKKVIIIVLCAVIAIPVVTVYSFGRDESVCVTVDGTEYVASFCGFNVGPTIVSYHEKYNSVFCSPEVSFYSGLWIMGSVETIGDHIMAGYVTRFCSTPDEVMLELNSDN